MEQKKAKCCVETCLVRVYNILPGTKQVIVDLMKCMMVERFWSDSITCSDVHYDGVIPVNSAERTTCGESKSK